LKFDVRIAVKSFIVKIELNEMPDMEVIKETIIVRIEQAIFRDGDEFVSTIAKKEKGLLTVENLEKLVTMNQ
jgi:type I restriction enzyme R subunit